MRIETGIRSGMTTWATWTPEVCCTHAVVKVELVEKAIVQNISDRIMHVIFSLMWYVYI